MDPLLKRIGKTLLVAIVVVEVALFFVLANRVEERLEPTTPQSQFRFATEVSSNDRARFSFNFPPRWEVAHKAAISTLKDPSQRAVVALGRAPEGDLSAVTEQLIGQLAESYMDVTQTSPRSEVIDGEVALVTQGTATNRAGATLRYRIAVIEGEKHNYAISAFVSDRGNKDVALDSIGEIISSFEPGD